MKAVKSVLSITELFRRARDRRLPRFSGMLAIGFLSTIMAMPSVEAAARTIVSLTFDDGLRESAAIQPLLNSALKATFYVNSNRIRLSGPIDNNDYLTKGELDTLFNNGHEIGGHTIDHADLATLSDAAQRQAICDDLVTLRGWYGDSVYSFAYPYSSTGPTTQSLIVEGCPGTYGPLNRPIGRYDSARAVGGAGCQACPLTESLPPTNPYYIATVGSVVSTTTLAEMQNYVTQAEANSGGWVIFNFHSVCNGCDTYAVTQGTLSNLLTWLSAREPQGTYVRTVHQVMSGDYPPSPPPPPLGPNLLINPSLEALGTNNQPDCWVRDSWGTNAATWTRSSDAFSGSFAQTVQMTAYTNGDRKLVPTFDAGQSAGGCAPPVEAGATYQISAHYKSTAGSTVVLFYLDANGAWQYWRDGPVLPASADWTQMTHNSGTLPTGASAMSFGIALAGIGTLTTDEYSMARILDTPPPVNTAPAFTGGATTLTVAANSPALDLKANLHVSDIDIGQTETWSASTAPAHGTLVITAATANSGSINITPGGTLTYQPSAGYSGPDSFSVRVSDGSASAIRTFAVTVAPPANTAPVFTGGTTTLTMAANSPAQDLKANLHVSDIDIGQTETWSASAAPAHGTLVITGATAGSGSINITPGGTLTYQPLAGYSGSDSFTVQVSDGSASASRTFAVTVTAPPANTAPTFTGGTTILTMAVNSPALDLKANLHVSDIDIGQTETWSASAAPAHGTLIITAATAGSGSTDITPGGTLTYQPLAGYTGSDSFTVQVSDGSDSASRTFAVTVSTAPNLVTNASLELDQDANSQPDCWQRGGWGTNTATWTRSSDAFSGSFAQALQISAYTNGDRKLLPTLDAGQIAGGCAPSVDANGVYRLSAYYKSTVTATVLLFYLDANGVWQYWRDGPTLPASNAWVQMVHDTGVLPVGARALSFGIGLSRIGTLTTDEYSMVRVN